MPEAPPVRIPERPRRPLLLVVAGPSGSGKSTLIEALLRNDPLFVASISATTRSPREGERDGVDYHFMDEERFRELIAERGFLEYAQVFGKDWYGTPKAFIEELFAAGRDVVTDVDVQGAGQIRGRMPDSVQVFVTPPSTDELARRLRGRGTEDERVIRRRLEEAARELARADEFQYLLVNDDLDRALDDLLTIVRAERLRYRR